MSNRIVDSPQIQQIIEEAEKSIEEILGKSVTLCIIKMGHSKNIRTEVVDYEYKGELPKVDEQIWLLSGKMIIREIACALDMIVSDYGKNNNTKEYVNLRRCTSLILYKYFKISYERIARLYNIPIEHTKIINHVRKAEALLRIKNWEMCICYIKAVNAVNKAVEIARKEQEKTLN